MVAHLTAILLAGLYGAGVHVATQSYGWSLGTVAMIVTAFSIARAIDKK